MLQQLRVAVDCIHTALVCSPCRYCCPATTCPQTDITFAGSALLYTTEPTLLAQPATKQQPTNHSTSHQRAPDTASKLAQVMLSSCHV